MSMCHLYFGLHSHHKYVKSDLPKKTKRNIEEVSHVISDCQLFGLLKYNFGSSKVKWS